jgi:ribosomal protein S3AE
MDLTTDKLRSMVKKWQVSIGCLVLWLAKESIN